MDHNEIINIVTGSGSGNSQFMSESDNTGTLSGMSIVEDLEKMTSAGIGGEIVRPIMDIEDVFSVILGEGKKEKKQGRGKNMSEGKVVNDDYDLAPKTKFKFRTVNDTKPVKLRKRSW